MSIEAKEEQIRNLSEPWGARLIDLRRGFVEQEKQNARDKDYAALIIESIDRGYEQLLDSILKISK